MNTFASFYQIIAVPFPFPCYVRESQKAVEELTAAWHENEPGASEADVLAVRCAAHAFQNIRFRVYLTCLIVSFTF
jgi:hypothetical protein